MDPEDDIEIAPDEEASAERAENTITKMRTELAACRKEKQEYMDGWQRAKADYVNALKRFEEEKGQERARGMARAAEALLPALDALTRAKEHGDVPVGFAGIAKQLESAFAELGLEGVGQTGEPFNPALHEALGQDDGVGGGEDDTVSAVLEHGWKMGDMLIRPAKVRIFHSQP